MKRIGLALIGVLIAAPPGWGAVPDPSKCTLGVNLPVAKRPFISVGGSTNGLPDACSDGRCADYTVEVRDATNNPLPASSVIVDFSTCSDIQIACDQLTAVTGQSFVDDKKVRGSTDGTGRFTFRIRGASNSASASLPPNGQSPGTLLGTPCARVYADGVLIGSLKVSAFDIDGSGSPVGAVNSADVQTVNAEVQRGAITGIHYQRTDLNADGAANAADVTFAQSLVTDAVAGTGTRSTGPYCPNPVTCTAPPIVQTISNQSATEGTALVVVPSGFDPDGGALAWSGQSLPAGATVDVPTGTLAWTPCLDQSGTYPGVTLTAFDPCGSSSSRSFTITVAPRNPAVYGACDFTDGTCLTLKQSECVAAQGVYRGNGTTCVPDSEFVTTPVDPPPVPSASLLEPQQDNDESIVIPLKVNVLKPNNYSADDAKKMVEEANKILEQAHIKFEFDPDKHYHKDVSDGGNNDGKFDKAEEDGLFDKGAKEIEKKKEDGGMDGQGFKVYIGDRFVDRVHYLGLAKHKIPVALVRFVSASTEGRTLAHEFCHTRTLFGPYKWFAGNNKADEKGHVPGGNNNLMEESGVGTELSPEQIELIRKPQNAPSGGKTKKVNPNNNSAIPRNVRSGIWIDPRLDVSHPALDLSFGSMFVDDPAVNFVARIGINGFLATVPDTLSYQVAFDTDHRGSTGATWGSFSGIEKVLDVRCTGTAPFSWASDNLHATLIDLVAGTRQCIPAGGITREYQVYDGDSVTTSSSEAYGHLIEQPVSFMSMGFTGDTVSFGIRSVELGAGGAVDLDELPMDEFYVGPRPGPNLVMTPLAAAPGDTVSLVGTEFHPSSPIEIYLRDSLGVTTTASGSGAFTRSFIVPLVPNGHYFVTARDTTSDFDFSVLEVVNSALGLPGAGTRPARLTVDRNPFHDVVAFSVPGDGPGAIVIVDVGGRAVRRLSVDAAGATARRVTWDGRRTDGHEAPSGVYFARLLRGSLRASVRIVKSR